MLELIKVLLTTPSFYIIIVMLVGFPIVYPKILGFFGELYTKQSISKLSSTDYHVINNLLLMKDNKTCQIDHIVISKYGIFVIESKQYNGYITGNKYDKKWVRHVGRKKIYYENPIAQNYGHIKFLSSFLNTDEKKFINLVCISSRAKLKIKHDGELVNCYTINDMIKSHQSVIIDDVEAIKNILQSSNITDKKVLKEHINSIKQNIKEDENKCPKCGELLIERDGKYGKFYGCSNYPKCDYTRK